MKKYINRNYFWAELFVKQLYTFGVKYVCLSPGSRNTPLTLAFAENKSFKKYIHVDERSSCFFALGLSKKIKKPVVVVTTSGTAVAELYPAIIEAYIQRVPLIICTADRPAYLRNTGANQTINQNNIFNNHIRAFVDFGLPSLAKRDLKVYSEKIYNNLEIGSYINPGPVHLNFPFKKPLEPNSFSDDIDLKISDFIIKKNLNTVRVREKETNRLIALLKKSRKPLIHISWDQLPNKFFNALIRFSSKNNIPILVDGTSELRFYKGINKTIVVNHSSFLGHLKDQPDIIIQFGNAPTSQSVLKYFEETSAKRILINQFGDIKDPSKTKGELFKLDPLALILELNKNKIFNNEFINWCNSILEQDSFCEVNKKIVSVSNFGNESKIVLELLSMIPDNSNLFISNSLPIRDFDYFAPKMKKGLKIFTNRGASGIDGIISTASGIAAESKDHTYLLIGDLSFYHNISALSTLHELKIPLKIILINNNGGGIFNMLPVSDGSENFNKYFTTSQNLDFGKIVKSLNGVYYYPKSWTSFRKDFAKMIINEGYTVIEIKANSKKSLEIRKKYWKSIQKSIQ